MRIKQVHHPYWHWEEINHNMWGSVSDRKSYLGMAIRFTSKPELYGHYMRIVANHWSVSCENALTDPHLNHRAWIGHAACAMALRCPEDIVREAWRHLTDEQKFLANQEADRAIAAWKHDYIKSKKLDQNVGGPMLWGGDTGHLSR